MRATPKDYSLSCLGVKSVERLAELIAELPSAPDERWFGEDLAALPLWALRRERGRLALASALSARSSWWASERLCRVEDELEIRALTVATRNGRAA